MKSFYEAVDTRPEDVKDGEVFAMKVIAVAGYNGDWACYVGATDMSDEDVLKGGFKVDIPSIYPFSRLMRLRKYRE